MTTETMLANAALNSWKLTIGRLDADSEGLLLLSIAS